MIRKTAPLAIFLSLVFLSWLPLSRADSSGYMTFIDPSCETDQADSFSGEFKLFASYVSAYRKRDALARSITAAKIRESVFSAKDPGKYVAILKFLDCEAATYPEAVFDLARSLQIHWENAAPFGAGPGKYDPARIGTEIGSIAGISILAFAMFKDPKNVPRYFQYYRHFLPILTAAAGNLFGQGYRSIRLDSKSLPAPAEVMNLATPGNRAEDNVDALVREIFKLTASTGSFSATFDAVKASRAGIWAARLSLPFRLNPPALISGFLVSAAVEYGLGQMLDDWTWDNLSAEVQSAVSAFDTARFSGNEKELYSAATRLTIAATRLSMFMKRDFLKAVKDLNEGQSAALQKLNGFAPTSLAGIDDFELCLRLHEGLYDHAVDNVLLESAAMIRSAGKDFLTDRVDFLMNQVRQDERIMGGLK